MRIEEGENRKRAIVSCLNHLCFGEEKMMFRSGEVVLYKLKIEFDTANVAEVDMEKVEEKFQ